MTLGWDASDLRPRGPADTNLQNIALPPHDRNGGKHNFTRVYELLCGLAHNAFIPDTHTCLCPVMNRQRLVHTWNLSHGVFESRRWWSRR